jgi:hypothetical protein
MSSSFPVDAYQDVYSNDLVVLDKGSKFWVSLPCKFEDIISEDGRLVLYEDVVGAEGSYIYQATVREPIELVSTTVASLSDLIESVVAVYNYQTGASSEITTLSEMFNTCTNESTLDGFATREVLKEDRESSGVYYLTKEASKKMVVSGSEVKKVSYRIPLSDNLVDERECEVMNNTGIVQRFVDNIERLKAGTLLYLDNELSEDDGVNILRRHKAQNDSPVVLCESVNVIDTRMSDEATVMTVLERLKDLQSKQEPWDEIDHASYNKILEDLPIESSSYKTGSLRSLFSEYVPSDVSGFVLYDDQSEPLIYITQYRLLKALV